MEPTLALDEAGRVFMWKKEAYRGIQSIVFPQKALYVDIANHYWDRESVLKPVDFVSEGNGCLIGRRSIKAVASRLFGSAYFR